jgi:glucokinase
MAEAMVLGVDLGGTYMRVALVDVKGVILRLEKAPVNIGRGADQATRRLIDACRGLAGEAEALGGRVLGLGVGVAGKIDRHRGEVVFSPNLPAMNGHPLGTELQESLDFPVILENDANAFGIGESWVGSGRGLTNWIGVTLGTGVGGCLIFGGELWEGDGLGFAGEIGHMNVDPNGPSCACGLRGCLEAHASAGALVRAVDEAVSGGLVTAGPLLELWRMGNLTGEAVHRCTKLGDRLAGELFRRMGWALGIALAGLFTVLGIRHAIIGGGVGNGWDEFVEPLKSSLAEHCSFLAPEEMVVVRSALGDHAALLGAARLAWRMIPESRIDLPDRFPLR